ncbi:MAG TPA: type III-B CRISPR module RAMP protein Cmr6 [Gammaproteobacteria bacterium]|nr:type III-B CRISPR module RAMP protein Cmr6 [Gammaproteobacteria bacterium]
MRALIARQKSEFSAINPGVSCTCFDALAVAPFTTGLGNEHPLENGFAFLNPYGLPYLPGSGVKGVLRQAARELASGAWGEPLGWSENKSYWMKVGKERVELSVIDVLFGLESGDGDTAHVRGALSFWDVIPQIKGDSLMVEIMTPHQSHYYQQKPAAGSVSPHDSGSPNPICFLTVPPGSSFTFHVVCDTAHLARLTRERAAGMSELFAEGETHWRSLLQHAFEHAFEWLGFGAKTAVGYGAMRELSSKEVAAFEVARLQCEWVDRTIGEIATRHKVPSSRIDDVIRGKHLAEAWSAIEDEDLKRKALADIQSRWQAKGWWESPPPGVASKAKAMYTTDGK